MSSLPINPTLKDLTHVYQSSAVPIEEVAHANSALPASQIIKLASNENPLGPSPAALKDIRVATCSAI